MGRPGLYLETEYLGQRRSGAKGALVGRRVDSVDSDIPQMPSLYLRPRFAFRRQRRIG